MNILIPEPLFDLRAQIGCLLDPEHPRKTLIITEPRPGLTEQLLERADLEGCIHESGASAWFSRLKCDPEQIGEWFSHFFFGGLADEETCAEILGYSAPKTALEGLQRVVQARRSDGAVLFEQVVDNACAPAAWATAVTYADDVQIYHPADVLIRRLQLLKQEGWS